MDTKAITKKPAQSGDSLHREWDKVGNRERIKATYLFSSKYLKKYWFFLNY